MQWRHLCDKVTSNRKGKGSGRRGKCRLKWFSEQANPSAYKEKLSRSEVPRQQWGSEAAQISPLRDEKIVGLRSLLV